MLISQLLPVWIGLIMGAGCVSYRSYQTRIEKRENGLKIKSILEDEGSDIRSQYFWVDISVFSDIGIQPEDCSSHENNFCLKWSDKADLEIAKITEDCERYEWKTKLNTSLSISFSLQHTQLYGGPESSYQTWPIQKSSALTNNVPYVTYDGANFSQSVLERYWLTSKGQYLYVDETVPLFVSQNETTLTFTAFRADPYIRKNDAETVLKFRFCELKNVKAAHLHAIAHVFEKPTRVPDFKMVQYPIWSTWAMYKASISEKNVMEYANAISQNGFPNSALEIDDKWETCYGSFTVDRTKFPNLTRLVSELKAKGFRVTMWIHPFIDVYCDPFFSFARDSGFLVKNKNGSFSSRWWNGVAGAIDFTNPEGVQWWVNRLRDLKNETGVDSFKFDAGEMSYLPQTPVFNEMSADHPDTYIKAYVKTVDQFGDMIEVRTARGVQSISPFVRMIDRETRWTGYRSMETLIPALLQMNIIGYPFVLPDMIGGNDYGAEKLTEEMYLRWLQISVFMPALQFSLPPWTFGNKTIEITKKYIKLHALYAEKIHNLMIKATKDGTPVNFPVWWIDPEDAATHTIDSEFLLGEDLLVAPITKEGAVSRDIYLIKGTWRDENHPRTSPIQGPILLKNYKADLHVLPYFTRLDCETCGSSTLVPKLFSVVIVVALIWTLY